MKNIAFLMNRQGEWRLSPAFDVAYSYNSVGAWTHQHQMSVNNKRDGFEREDLIALAGAGGIKKASAARILSDVSDAVRNWHSHGAAAGVPKHDIVRLERTFRNELV